MFKKMDQEAKRRWVIRLRSGVDLQGTNVLRDSDDKKCCLGVLADEMGIPRQLLTSGGRYEYTFPPEVTLLDWDWPSSTAVPVGFCGLTETAISTLMTMNDEQRKTFDEIAYWVDVYL